MENSSDITSIIIETINTILGNLFASIDNNLYTILDDIIFISSDIIHDSYFEKILGTSASNGILLISNALLFGFLLYYAVKYLFSHLTFSQVESPIQFVFKAVILGTIISGIAIPCWQRPYIIYRYIFKRNVREYAFIYMKYLFNYIYN